ncbi:aminoglycoside phosphotransferase family protein [Psychrobacter aestuarii]|uniref:Phosphotransferase n=1 Tax=Psychrobacter aestuarii TaxID=556327 RepID=A0ABN0VZB6_9GAMM|nr:phosphotransferase [Psychrobacter aestuarii]
MSDTPAPTPLSSADARLQQLTLWLEHVFANQLFSLDSLAGDASARRYHRLQLQATENKAGGDYMVMDSADEQEALKQFLAVATLMRPVVNVPDIFAEDVDKGFLVLQDFGGVEFAHLLTGADATQVDGHYTAAMQSLAALQTLPISINDTLVLPLYDAALLTQEMQLFRDWFVPHIDALLDNTLWENVLNALVTQITNQPQVIVHRDYHSRNLMQDRADSERLGIIDFQDAVIGAYSYDFVSLVRDAYVDWSEAQITAWTEAFWQLQQMQGVPSAATLEQFTQDVMVMGVQRHLKVLGIFVRLFKRDGKARYLNDIPKVMRDLLVELEWLSKHGDASIKQAVTPFYQHLQTHIYPAYAAKFLSE